MEQITPMKLEKERSVLVFSRTPLFGEGMLKLLSSQDGVRILGIAATIAEVRELAEQEIPDVIIMNQSDRDGLTGQALSDLLDIANGPVLSFTLAERDMVIYTRRRVPASIRELLNILGENKPAG